MEISYSTGDLFLDKDTGEYLLLIDYDKEKGLYDKRINMVDMTLGHKYSDGIIVKNIHEITMAEFEELTKPFTSHFVKIHNPYQTEPNYS